MRLSTIRETKQRLIAALEDPTGGAPARTTSIALDRYLDPEALEQEQAVLFRRRPIVVAHASELAQPGQYIAEDLGGVPIVVVRDESSRLRAFVNACRHRSSRLLSAERGVCPKLISCPYHGWTYRLDGSLFKIPRDAAFGAVDRSALGLHEVAIEERHGFVWAQLEGPLDVKSFLGPELDEDFAEFELDRHHVLTSGVHVRRANWKLVVDAFCEAYHVPVLHAQTLARFFIEPQVVHDCAPHIRQFGGRRSLLEARDQPSWELREHATILYNVFPNTALIFHPLWIGALTILPEAVDRVRVIHRCLVSEGYDREKVEKSFTHIDRLVVHGEDLAMVESIQSTLHAGSREMILGGCEEGVRLFHAARDAALRGS